MFNESTKTYLDPYGGDTPEIDDKWEELLQVGILKLTSKEVESLEFTPAKLYGGQEGEYAGFLEVFHQIHCLVRFPFPVS